MGDRWIKCLVIFSYVAFALKNKKKTNNNKTKNEKRRNETPVSASFKLNRSTFDAIKSCFRQVIHFNGLDTLHKLIIVI